MSGIFNESFDTEDMDDMSVFGEADEFDCEVEEGCTKSKNECDDPITNDDSSVKEGDDVDDDYDPSEDDVLDVEESMLDDVYDTMAAVHEADDASVEDINAYEKSREDLFDGETTMKDVEDMMDDELGSDMVVSDDLDVLGVNNDDMVVVPDDEL